MQEKHILSRIHTDTFKGGEFHREMTENLSSDNPSQIDKNDFNIEQWRSTNEIEDCMEIFEEL